MNYQKIYNQLISQATGRIVNDYTEKHHIIPKCLGGTDNKNNLVNLTPEEHFVAHQLLVKINPTHEGLLFALRFMATKNIKHKRNNKKYGWIKRRISKLRTGHTLSVGEKNGMFGKTHTQETKEKISEKAKERDPASYNFARLPKTDIHKENLRKSKQTSKYKLISPNNTEYILDRIAEASKISGISNSVLVKLAGNRYKFDNCRGWKIFSIPLQ